MGDSVFRTLCGIPSGPISIADAYGKPVASYIFSGNMLVGLQTDTAEIIGFTIVNYKQPSEFNSGSITPNTINSQRIINFSLFDERWIGGDVNGALYLEGFTYSGPAITKIKFDTLNWLNIVNTYSNYMFNPSTNKYDLPYCAFELDYAVLNSVADYLKTKVGQTIPVLVS